MAGRLAQLLDKWHQRRVLQRWKRVADGAAELDVQGLRTLRTEVRGIRRHLDRVMQVSDMMLSRPALGSGLPNMPLGTDWAWRPDAWRGAIAVPGLIGATGRTEIAEGHSLHHDCALQEVILRQVRNHQESDRAPFGLAIDVFGFRGSFLSLAIDLPREGLDGLTSRHLIRVDLIMDSDRPFRSYARLNIKHGPNLAQPVSSLPDDRPAKLAEFDLAYADINVSRIERAWLDIIINDASMARIRIRDVVLSRRPRAEL